MTITRIWDLPTRLYHWLLVLCVIGLLVTAQIGGNAMPWHFRLGQTVLSLLLFRLFWGFLGGHWSRWRQLPIAPRHVLNYWLGRKPAGDWPGHNPAGSWSLLAMLCWLGLQAGSGLFSDDEIAFSGPLTAWASSHWIAIATSWHKGTGKVVLLLLVTLHVSAIAWYRWRHSLILLAPMIHGFKSLTSPACASQDSMPSRLLALLLWLCCMGLVFGTLSILGT